MEMKRVSLETCSEATGTVVVIDVIRAFTTAAFAFAAGARDITLVRTVEEALALRSQLPGSLVMGEVGGLPVEGFDFSNSPTELVGEDLTGRRMIQRTSAGTQGVVRSLQAEAIFAASFTCAGATARFLLSRSSAPGQLPPEVTFVITGEKPEGWGDEDAACADYLEALLLGEAPASELFLERARESLAGQMFADPQRPEFPASDLAYCLEVDRFDFAMRAERRRGLFVLAPVD